MCVIIAASDVLRNFWIFLKMSGILIYLTGNQNMLVLYLHVFTDSMFSIAIFSTHFTLLCSKCLLHMKKHFYEVLLYTSEEMEEKKNGRQSSLGLLQTMTALQLQFHNITLACDDSLTMQTHKVMLADISTVSGWTFPNWK